MAAHGPNPGTSTSPTGPQVDDLFCCPICLDIFQSPKILPGCFHTFCEACLTNITNGSPFHFHCPTCREFIQVPPGGTSAFKTNLYINSDDLEKARKGLFCGGHPKLELELYCVQCGCCICFKCKYTEHAEHETEDLGMAAEKAKAQLAEDTQRLDDAVVRTQKRSIDEVVEDQQQLHTKKIAIRKDIQNRHAALVAIADQIRDQTLASVESETEGVNSRLSQHVLSARQHLAKLVELQTRVQNATEATARPAELFAVAKEMKDGAGKQEAVEKLTPQPWPTVSWPVLQSLSGGAMNTASLAIRDCLGSVVQLDMGATTPEVSVQKHFRCSRRSCSVVFSLCPVQDDYLWVCFHLHDSNSECAYTNLYDSSGRFQHAMRNVSSTITFKAASNLPRGMFKKQDGSWFTTYTKSTSLLKLEYDRKKHLGVVRRSTMPSPSPLTVTPPVEVFIINCGKQRACDTDSSEELFVVVEEAQPPEKTRRKVRLYQFPRAESVDTYVPPAEASQFQPSDVCFYRLGGLQVLLVADEASDAIHVVSARGGRLEFLRYLAPGCPLLLQPTALNADTRGRLWVACRGGSILLCEPV